MKKIVRLTERDLTRLVKRVINEGVIAQPLTKSYLNGRKEGETGTFKVSAAANQGENADLYVTFSDGKTYVVYGNTLED